MLYKVALEKLFDSVYDSLNKSGINWVIMGSIATVLHGIDIIPNDVDILTRSPKGVYKFAELMEDYTVPKCDEKPVHYNEKWRSSKELPVIADEPNPREAVWYFGRWFINNFKIECAHITPPEDYRSSRNPHHGIWEGGPEIWPHLRMIKFKSYLVPVLPLEIQLETNFRRDYTERINKIISYFKKNSYDRELLRESLSEENMRKFNHLIRKKR